MRISTILDHIDSGHMALPEFQRGYVWNRDQVRSLFDSLYRRHPIGGLLVWVTESQSAEYRGDGQLAPGIVKLLLDGQQRITSLYGVIRGKPPRFFDGNTSAFTGLQFHLENQVFEFYQSIKMKGDPMWIDVTNLMKQGMDGLGKHFFLLSQNQSTSRKATDFIGRLTRLLGITDIELHIEEVTGEDKTVEVVVDIFNRVNSGGTKLSKGDLALAKICAEWPDARDLMKGTLSKWSKVGYSFTLDWLLRSINAVVTGEARFHHLHNKSASEIQQGLALATRYIDDCLNLISGRLGIDHDRVFFAKFAVPVIVRYLSRRQGTLTDAERDKLLFWFVQSGMWGRFSGSTESYLDKDFHAIEEENDLDNLLKEFRLWHGNMRVRPEDFAGWSLGARFYPVLYMLTRMSGACDWGNGLPLRSSLLGRMNALEVHHIFPKARLYKHKYNRAETNSVANFCFLTKDTNLEIRDRYPEQYFPEIEEKHPGALASQWIPMDKDLWKIQNYLDFLEARKVLLAQEMNRRLEELLHGDIKWLEGIVAPETIEQVVVGVTSETVEEVLENLNSWVEEQGLPAGIISYDFADIETGEQKAVFDIAWPNGIQAELSQPVAVLLNETTEVISLASAAGYRCFNTVSDFKEYVENEILRVVLS